MEEYESFVGKLKSYALDELTIAILAARCCFNWRFSEIAQEFSIVSVRKAQYIFQRGTRLLKERGYK